MGYIDRSFDSPLYHYARANGSTGVFYTTASYNTSGVGAPVASLVDLYHRELVHVPSGNYVLVYKRAVRHSATSTLNNIWRWHTINAVTPVGSTYRADSGNNRQFRRLIQSSATPTYVSKLSSDYGVTSYREELTMPISSPAYSLEVFQETTTATGSMQAMAPTPQTGIGLPLDHTFRGVTINETVFKHFLWSTDDYGVTPTTMRYYVQRNGTDDIHRVFNLKPGQEYLVTESNSGLPSGYYKYVFVETFNSGITANSAGVAEFTPAQLGTIGVNYYSATIDDGFFPNSDSVVSTQALYSVGVADESATNSTDSVVPVGDHTPNTYPEDIDDEASANSSSAVNVNSTLTINDSGGTTVDVVDVTLVGAPGPIETEKRIDGPITSLIPNQDLLVSFFYPEPNDNVFYTKVNDADDDDFIRVISLPIVSQSEIRFGLTDSSGSVSTIRSIQFAVKVRSAVFTAIDSPFLHMNLYRGSVANNITDWDISLQQTDESVWLRSPIIPVLIDRLDIPGLILRIRPRAKAYVGSYGLEISGVLVDVAGDATEKVL